MLLNHHCALVPVNQLQTGSGKMADIVLQQEEFFLTIVLFKDLNLTLVEEVFGKY